MRGVSLIELLIGIAVFAISLALGMPSLNEWINNSQVRNTAESLQNGLNFARAEAVRRNTVVRLQFTDTLASGCVLSTSGASWIVNMSQSVTPAGLCGADVSDSTSPFILQKGSPVTSKTNAQVSASPQAVIAFNGLGRIAGTTNPTTGVGGLTLQITSSSGTCVAAGGKVRCLNVLVTPAGQTRMCDPARSASATPPDPMAC